MLLSQEDTFLRPAYSDASREAQEAALGQAGTIWDVLILRDPFNLFASRRGLPETAVNEATALRIWKQHARAVLKGPPKGAGRFVPILYDRWVQDGLYRRRIARELGLAYSEWTLDRVARCGGGSSFDGLAFDGRAGQMPVKDRWRRYASDPGFWRVFDAETVGLAEALFGEVPPPLAHLRRRAEVNTRAPQLRRALGIG